MPSAPTASMATELQEDVITRSSSSANISTTLDRPAVRNTEKNQQRWWLGNRRGEEVLEWTTRAGYGGQSSTNLTIFVTKALIIYRRKKLVRRNTLSRAQIPVSLREGPKL